MYSVGILSLYGCSLFPLPSACVGVVSLPPAGPTAVPTAHLTLDVPFELCPGLAETLPLGNLFRTSRLTSLSTSSSFSRPLVSVGQVLGPSRRSQQCRVGKQQGHSECGETL